MSVHKELLCFSLTLEEACKAIEADSRVSLRGRTLAGHRADLCLACFNGDYLTALYSSIEK